MKWSPARSSFGEAPGISIDIHSIGNWSPGARLLELR